MKERRLPNQNPRQDGQTIGGRVRKLRLEYGWSTERLGRESGVSPAAISSIENGIRGHKGINTTTAYKLAKALGVTPSWIAWGAEVTQWTECRNQAEAPVLGRKVPQDSQESARIT